MAKVVKKNLLGVLTLELEWPKKSGYMAKTLNLKLKYRNSSNEYRSSI